MAGSNIIGKKISELTQLRTNLLDTDLFLVSRNTDSVNTTYDVLKRTIVSDIDIDNVKSDVERINNIIGEDGKTIHGIESNVISNRTDIDAISTYTDQIVLSVDGISAKVNDIIVKSIPLATNDSVGGIMLGFEQTETPAYTKVPVEVTEDSKAYVIVPKQISTIDVEKLNTLAALSVAYMSGETRIPIENNKKINAISVSMNDIDQRLIYATDKASTALLISADVISLEARISELEKKLANIQS